MQDHLMYDEKINQKENASSIKFSSPMPSHQFEGETNFSCPMCNLVKIFSNHMCGEYLLLLLLLGGPLRIINKAYPIITMTRTSSRPIKQPKEDTYLKPLNH